MTTTANLPTVQQTEINGVSEKQTAYAFDVRESALHEVLATLSVNKDKFLARGVDFDSVRNAAIDAANAMTDAKSILSLGKIGVGKVIRTATQEVIKAAIAK